MASQHNVDEWLNWVIVTSIPLMQIDDGHVVGRATGTLVDYSGRRFLLSVEHALKRGTTGWTIRLGYDPEQGTEFFRPNAFAYAAEFTRSTKTLREIDLCFAEVSSTLEPMYEYRTPRGLFDKRPHHIFKTSDFAMPSLSGVFAFSGRVKTEQHGPETFVSDMVVYPGLKYIRSEDETHIFQLPVPHPGHDAFHGCSGAPIVDFHGHVVGLVTGGDIPSNTISGIAIQRCLPGVQFLCAGIHEAES